MNKMRSGLSAFILVAVGQMVSLLGSGMTQFGIAIWIFEQSGKATDFSLLAVTGFAPIVLFSPIAGALVDRWNRKFVMMISDLAAGLTTVAVFILISTGNLEIWHLYITNFVSGVFQAFQWPAYSAAITMMVPKEQYGRANGIVAIAGPASNIFAPILAAALLGPIGLEGIMIIDIITFSAAIGALLLVFIPQPKETEEGKLSRGSLVSESMFGFKYIFSRPSLLGLQLMFFYVNLTSTIGFTLQTPMILASTGNNEDALAAVMSVGSVGGLLGGLLLSAWGGPKRRIHGVLGGMVLVNIFSQILMGLGHQIGSYLSITILGATGAVLVWSAANFAAPFIITILNGSNQAIWQAKVPPDLQGKVFSARRWIAQITAPIGMLIAGPLADKVFEPAMSQTTLLSTSFGSLVGTGAGTGMALIFVFTGLLGVIGGFSGYLFPAIRNVEDIMPDHDIDVSKLTEQALSQADS
jgi:DHA3 family macrolide efflux protein-like MFS transporter